MPVPMQMPPVGETLSAGVLGMPPVSLGTLLRKLGIGAQGAEEPFGMPGERGADAVAIRGRWNAVNET